MYRKIIKNIFISISILIMFSNSLLSQKLGIDTYSKYLTFFTQEKESNTIYPANWVNFGGNIFPKEFDSTYSFLKWVQADYRSSEVMIKYRPNTKKNKLMFASEWVNYNGLSQNNRFAFIGKLKTKKSDLVYSRINFHQDIQVLTNIVKHDLTTHNLVFNHNRNKYINLYGSLKIIDINKKNVDSILLGHHFYTISKFGNSLSLDQLSQNFKFNVFWENVNYWYDDKYENLWNVQTGFNIKSQKIITNLNAKYYSNGKVYPQMNIQFNSNLMNIDLFYKTKSVLYELKKYFSNINFIDEIVGGKINLNITKKYYDIKYSGFIYSQLNNSNSLFYQTDSLILVKEGRGQYSNGELFASLNFNYFKIFSQLNYNIGSNFNNNFYHPGILDLHSGIISKFHLFDGNLLIDSKIEGMYQYHRNPNEVKFNSTLLKYIPIYQSNDYYSGDWTMNTAISGTVQTFTIELQIKNIFNNYIYSAQNLYPNQIYTQVTVYWSWLK